MRLRSPVPRPRGPRKTPQIFRRAQPGSRQVMTQFLIGATALSFMACTPRTPAANAGAGVIRINLDFQIENRARRRHQAAIFRKRRPRNVAVFWAAPSQANQLDRASTYHSGCVTPSEFASSQPAAPTECRVAIGEGSPGVCFCNAGVSCWPISEMAVARVGGRLSRYCGQITHYWLRLPFQQS
jgi:hypothetical protein